MKLTVPNIILMPYMLTLFDAVMLVYIYIYIYIYILSSYISIIYLSIILSSYIYIYIYKKRRYLWRKDILAWNGRYKQETYMIKHKTYKPISSRQSTGHLIAKQLAELRAWEQLLWNQFHRNVSLNSTITFYMQESLHQ